MRFKDLILLLFFKVMQLKSPLENRNLSPNFIADLT